jgi:hypothetical protein
VILSSKTGKLIVEFCGVERPPGNQHPFFGVVPKVEAFGPHCLSLERRI